MLGDFTAYDPAGWTQEGLLRAMPLPKARAAAPKRRQPWSTTMFATVALAFTTATGFAPGQSASAVSRPREAAPDFSWAYPGDPDIVGPGYWKNVASYLEHLPAQAADRDDIPDPDPLV